MAEGRTKWPEVADGWFVEPVAATHFLLDREDFPGGVWDPACGQGNIVQACLARGLRNSMGTDLRIRVPDEPDWFGGAADFIEMNFRRTLRPNVVMNPPYGRAKLAEAFIRKALAMEGVEKVAAFLNSKFLFGSGRAAGLYAEHPPSRVYPISPRPSCPPGVFLQGGGKAEGGVENFVWIVWDLGIAGGRTEMSWAEPEKAP